MRIATAVGLAAAMFLSFAALATPRPGGGPATKPATRPGATAEELSRAEKCLGNMTLYLVSYRIPGTIPDSRRFQSARRLTDEELALTDLTLTTNTDVRGSAGNFAKIESNECRSIVNFLLEDGFFASATDVWGKPPALEPNFVCCVLSVVGERAQYQENLGWGPAMLRRLDALRAVLPNDSQSAKAMDRWMRRFDAFRQWQQAATHPAGKAP
jgi:hypothetical protein